MIKVAFAKSTNSYLHLYHALKNTANQKLRKPLHILRYATGRKVSQCSSWPPGFPAERLAACGAIFYLAQF